LTSLGINRVQRGVGPELQDGLRASREKSLPLKRRATNGPSQAESIMGDINRARRELEK
jgi:hypothetical protein